MLVTFLWWHHQISNSLNSSNSMTIMEKLECVVKPSSRCWLGNSLVCVQCPIQPLKCLVSRVHQMHCPKSGCDTSFMEEKVTNGNLRKLKRESFLWKLLKLLIEVCSHLNLEKHVVKKTDSSFKFPFRRGVWVAHSSELTVIKPLPQLLRKKSDLN